MLGEALCISSKLRKNKFKSQEDSGITPLLGQTLQSLMFAVNTWCCKMHD
jgi:hypothetical protein